MFLAGDRNITNGMPVKNGLFDLTGGSTIGWTSELHDSQGDVLLADGSVQGWNTSALQAGLRRTSETTNRLAMP